MRCADERSRTALHQDCYGEGPLKMPSTEAIGSGNDVSYSNSVHGPSIQRKVNAVFAAALACLATVSLGAHLSIAQQNENARWVGHTQDVLRELEHLLAAVTIAETAERGYVITEDPEYLESYHRAMQLSETTQQQLAALTTDNSTEQQRLRELRALVAERVGQFDTVFQLRQTQGFEGAQREILKGLGKRMHDRIRAAIDQMQVTERSLLEQRRVRTERSMAVTKAMTWGGGVLALVFVGVAGLAIRRDFAGRERAERALRQAKDELELRVKQRTADLQLANDSIAQSERRFRAFISATADVVYRMSPDWTEMQHLEGQQFIADTTDPNRNWLAKYIHPDDQARVWEAIQEAIRTKGTFALEHRVLRVDGTLGWTFSRAVPLLSERGEIIEWFGAASDVSARKEAEVKLQAQLARLALLSHITRAIGERQDIRSIFQVVIRTLEEHLPADFCAICLYEPSATRLTVNSVGRHSEALAIELAMTEQAHIPIDKNGLSRCVQGQLVYEPDLAEVSFPFPQRLLRGGLKTLVAAPLLVESNVFGVLLTARRESHSFSSGECEFLRQVSEHVALAAHQAQLYVDLQRAYEDLRQTQKAIMQQERLRALGQMASGIAHDINNAISPVALYTESMLEHEQDLSPRVRRNLETIHRSIDDVSQTVARMREFYRERGPQAMSRVDIAKLLQQVIELTRARWSDMAQQRGVNIQVRTEVQPDLPPALGVESELRDALNNLIFNAVDAMPTGGTLTLRSRPREGQLVEVEVADSGVGMDEDTKRRCLEPFFTTKGDRGTGLGLAMVYGAMQRHGADIEIESAVGYGTTVRLILPIATQAQDVTSQESVTVVPRVRILLVDDDPLVLKSLQEILEADGHTITAADGGQAGIDAFLAQHAAGSPFDVVITDLGMPHVDGRRVSAAIKGASPDTVVVMLTGWGQRLVASGDIPAHVDRVLSKPPKLRELRDALARSLDGTDNP
jgi:signal transduction histidine kinase/CHASE3 domain sensor protein/ActR/RegA family two-component response regulator